LRLIHRLEPLLWALFGAGGFVAALLFPGLVLGLLLAGPADLLSDYATSYARMHGLASNPVGRLLVFAMVSLVFWHSAHHLRHFFLDLGLKRLEGPLCYALYGLALAGTAVALRSVAAL
jgi:fumarate reductase subunit D